MSRYQFLTTTYFHSYYYYYVFGMDDDIEVLSILTATAKSIACRQAGLLLALVLAIGIYDLV